MFVRLSFRWRETLKVGGDDKELYMTKIGGGAMPHQSRNFGSHVEPAVAGCDASRRRFCQWDLRRQSVKSNIIQTALCDGLVLCNVLKRRFFPKPFSAVEFQFQP